MHKRWFILLILMCSIVYAQESNFNTGISAVKDKIFQNESAIFSLDVYSSSAALETFTIYTDVEWTLSTEPADDKIFQVYPNSQKQTILLIKPKSEANIIPGAHTVRVYLKNQRTDQIIKNEVIVHVKSDTPFVGQYLPSLRTTVQMDKNIDPRKDIEINVYIENQNPLDLEAVDISITSDLIQIRDTIPIYALEKKELKYTAKIDDTTNPTDDTVKVAVKTFRNDRMYEFNAVPVNYHVIAYGDVEESVTVEKSFLKRVKTYTVANKANTQQEHTLMIKRSLFVALFNSFDEAPVVKKISGKKYYTWDMNLSVRGQRTYVETINFRQFATIILLILVLGVLYLIFRSPLLIRKKTAVVSTKDGGIAEISIQIDVKNRSAKSHTGIEILDKVPNMFLLIKEFGIGTIHPFQILKHEKRGTIVKWKIDDIEPFEERIITYRMTSKLNIIGKLMLPAATLHFKSGEKIKRIHSNKVLMAKK